MKEHANFHRCASEVLKLASWGRRQEAKAYLNAGGPFTEVSIRTINAIPRLRRKVEEE